MALNYLHNLHAPAGIRERKKDRRERERRGRGSPYGSANIIASVIVQTRGIPRSEFLHMSHVNRIALLAEIETPKSALTRAIDQSVGDPLSQYDRYLLTHAH